MKTYIIIILAFFIATCGYSQSNKKAMAALKSKSVTSTLKNTKKNASHSTTKKKTYSKSKTSSIKAINNIDAIFELDNPYTMMSLLSEYGTVESKDDDYPSVSIILSNVKLNHGAVKATLMCLFNDETGSKSVILYFDDNTIFNNTKTLVRSLLNITSKQIYIKENAFGLGNYAGVSILESLGFTQLSPSNEDSEE